MYSQRDEESFILAAFPDKTDGRFLDIGAYDGKCFSTTHALALRGWGGVCLEPSPNVFPALEKLYKDRPDIDTIPAALHDFSGTVDFWDSGGDMVSSTDWNHAHKWEAGVGCAFTKIKVACFSPLDLFERIGIDFDFISLDVEGVNVDLFKQLPLKALTKTKLICVEYDFRADEILAIVKPYGFSKLHKTEENLLLIRE